MKILFIHNFYQQRGGEETTFFNDIVLLKRNNHKVVIFSKDNREIDGTSLFKKILISLGVIFSFSTYEELKKIIEKEKPDVAHIHNIFPLLSPSVYYALRKYNIPIIQTLHNYRLLCVNGLFLRNNDTICELCKKGNFLYSIIYRCYRHSFMQSFLLSLSLFLHKKVGTFDKVAVFVSPSKFLKKKMSEGGIPDNKIVFKPHFLIAHKNYSLDDFKDYAVYMGRLSKEKGIFTLLAAWKDIKHIKLKIIGKGDIQHKLEKLAVDKGINNVEFLGFIENENRFEILKKAAFLIYPSECYENMPYTIIESFSLGTPVIASRIGTIKELVEDNVTGLLFEPKNSYDLAKKVTYLFENENRGLLLEMRRNAYELVKERYSQDIGYGNIMDTYTKVKR